MSALSKITLTTIAATIVATLAGCNGESAPAANQTSGTAKVTPVVIYSNADEEAQQAMKNALDQNGLKGAYLIQGFGTSELGGKLVAEGKAIEADVVTLSTYYLESLQQQKHLFAALAVKPDTINHTTNYYAPILGNRGA